MFQSLSIKDKKSAIDREIERNILAMAAMSIRNSNIKKGVIKDNTKVKPAVPKVKAHPNANALEKISKVLSKMEDVNNSKVDTLRLLYLFLEKDGSDGYGEKDLINYLKRPDKVKVVRNINVTVTK